MRPAATSHTTSLPAAAVGRRGAPAAAVETGTDLLVACAIGEADGRGLELSGGGHVDVVALEGAPAGDDGAHRRLRVSRKFLRQVGEHLLGLRRGQELQELDRARTVLRVRGDAGAR